MKKSLEFFCIYQTLKVRVNVSCSVKKKKKIKPQSGYSNQTEVFISS